MELLALILLTLVLVLGWRWKSWLWRLIRASVLPSKVMDLEVSVDSLEPSVTLKWSSPTDWIAKKCLNEYQIYFNGHILSVQSTTCNLSRDQGLVPLQSTAFNVRAVSQCVAGEWCTVNAFIDWTPLPVQEFTAIQRDPNVSAVTLTWRALGGLKREDAVRYEVCFTAVDKHMWGKYGCGVQTVQGTSITLSDLPPKTTYEFKIRALVRIQGVPKDIPGRWCTSNMFVDWEPGQVQHFTIKQNDLSVPDVTLSWTAPRGLRKEDVVIYEICFIEKNASVWGKDGCGHCKVEGTSVRLSVLPQATYEFNIRALIAFIGVSNEIPGRWYSSEKFVEWVLKPVQNLTVTQTDCHTNIPKVLLKWDPPSNTKREWDVTYQVQCHGTIYNTSNTAVTVRYLAPLTTCTYEVRALDKARVHDIVISRQAVWQSKQKYIEWYCQFPQCVKNRKRTERGSISNFCSKMHARQFASCYCLFPGCLMMEGKDFCNPCQKRAAGTGFAAVVEVDQSSEEFTALCDKFYQDWAKGSMPVGSRMVLRVVNPTLSERLNQYADNFPYIHRHFKWGFHGTRLECDMDQSLVFCKSSACGACGIAQNGMDTKKISKTAWQRYGPGFYFATNSSKAHDYAERKQNCEAVCAVFLCDVAVGKEYTTKYNASQLQGPPKGYHSVHGVHSKHGSLNYDELVVYNTAAVYPRYIFLY